MQQSILEDIQFKLLWCFRSTELKKIEDLNLIRKLRCHACHGKKAEWKPPSDKT